MDKVMEFLDSVSSELSSKQLKVGFLEGATYPDGTSMPMVAASNEFGNPASGSPPRPFFRNAIASKSEEWSEKVEKLMKSHDGDTDTVLNLIGEIIKAGIQESIRTIQEPPLSQVTVLLRSRFPNNRAEMTKWDVVKAREDVFGGPGYFGPVKKVDVDMSNNKPLIWTGDMLRAVDYEVGEIESSTDSQ